MREMSCFFTGHRRIAKSDENRVIMLLDSAIKEKIDMGICTFIAGGAVGFDMLAAEAVLRFRDENPDIRLCLYLPHKNHDVNWGRNDKQRLFDLIQSADEVRYISQKYSQTCMKERNLAMIRDAHYCIAWNTGVPSGTNSTVLKAKEVGCDIINLY